MRIFSVIAALALTGLMASTSSAILITGFNAGASTAAGPVYTVNSVNVVTNAQNNANGANAPAVNTIVVDINIHQKHVPFNLVFDVVEDGTGPGGAPAPANTTEYLLTVVLTNQLTGGSPGSAISGFDIATSISGANLAISSPTDPPAPTSTFSVLNPNLGPGLPFRFGGLQGGGSGQITAGQTATSTLPIAVIALANTTGTVSLEFTANPEPATIGLAALAMIPAGVVVYRRRRKKNA